MMKMDINLLNTYESNGLLMSNQHPTLPLKIWNYTQKVQYEGLWDDITLNCRGLVTDLDGNIVSRGFPKFFNIEENKHTPTDTFEVYEKLDGQYIGVFWYEGRLIVNSRGSFTSSYVQEATWILKEKYPQFLFCKLPSGVTYCFELTGFEQIVVSYPEPDLTLIGCFYADGEANHFLNWSLGGIRKVTRYTGLDYKNIKQLNWKNAEGFVVRFSNGDRCKIKFEDYIRLHRAMTNISEKKIWKALYDGVPISSILGDVPDEFYDKVHEYELDLKDKYEDIELDSLVVAKYYEGNDDRKSVALDILNRRKDHSNIIFAMLDGKDYSKMIWKLVEPKFEKI